MPRTYRKHRLHRHPDIIPIRNICPASRREQFGYAFIATCDINALSQFVYS